MHSLGVYGIALFLLILPGFQVPVTPDPPSLPSPSACHAPLHESLLIPGSYLGAMCSRSFLRKGVWEGSSFGMGHIWEWLSMLPLPGHQSWNHFPSVLGAWPASASLSSDAIFNHNPFLKSKKTFLPPLGKLLKLKKKKPLLFYVLDALSWCGYFSFSFSSHSVLFYIGLWWEMTLSSLILLLLFHSEFLVVRGRTSRTDHLIFFFFSQFLSLPFVSPLQRSYVFNLIFQCMYVTWIYMCICFHIFNFPNSWSWNNLFK